MTTVRVCFNPLKFTQIDLAGQDDGDPTADQVVDYLSDPEGNSGLQTFLARYRDITAVEDPALSVAPAEKNILQKLVWPLRHAKGNYAVGNHLGCIAVCGMVGEMVAVLLWEISEVSLQQARLNQAAQKALSGRTFESLGQARRVEVLRDFDLIDEETKQKFSSLSSIRNRYLHFFSQEHTDIVSDSRRAYTDAFGIVAVVLGQSFQNGKILLRPDLMAYLTEHGLVESSSAAGGTATEGGGAR